MFKELEEWRKERGLDKSQGFEFNKQIQASFLFEEMGVEYLRAENDYQRIDALCDTVVFCINGYSLVADIDKLNIEKFIDIHKIFSATKVIKEIYNLMADEVMPAYYFKKIIKLCFKMVEDMGYDFEKCMDETIKEISSRTGAYNPKTKKWEKFKTEEAMKLWYKADYSKCKR